MTDLLGLNLEAKDLTIAQVCLRGIIVFVVALIMLRLANRRFLAKLSAFDAILGFILASMLARAVNGSSAFIPTLVCGFVLVLLHGLLAALAYHIGWFDTLVKGRTDTLVENGQCKPAALCRHKITENDLQEELRLNGKIESVEEARLATLERNGKISVVPAGD